MLENGQTGNARLSDYRGGHLPLILLVFQDRPQTPQRSVSELAQLLAVGYVPYSFTIGTYMRILLALLVLSPVATLAQNPFDGTWIIDTNTTQLPQKPEVYLLTKGMFRWAGTEIKIGRAHV